MIEKLKRPVKIGGTTFREKINELVDAVNDIQKEREAERTNHGRSQKKIDRTTKQ